MLDNQPCFEHAITREGVPSSLGHHCIEDQDYGACVTNADCNQGTCVADTAVPTFVTLFCPRLTGFAGIDQGAGVPGPGSLTLRTLLQICRCGDGSVGCDEACDDGNFANGDGCDQSCHEE